MGIKAIPTIYRGIEFRSKLEAQWAVFFDAMGIPWEYEPQAFDLGGGLRYRPDFLVKATNWMHIDKTAPGPEMEPTHELWIEVKGEMQERDAQKILRFEKEHPLLVLRNIPYKISDLWKYNGEGEFGTVSFSSFHMNIGQDCMVMFAKRDGGVHLISTDAFTDAEWEETNAALQRARRERFDDWLNGRS